ncbi:MAG: 50S ribosome-binding GTPase, partial [Phycisphaerales bacterium]
GCTVVLTGPPNSGKSTLLNYLAGRQKAIVTDVRGTTRDWVEAECRIGPLSVTLFDTAGLEPELSGHRAGIEGTARGKTTELLDQADLVLLVLDSNRPSDEVDDELLGRISGKRVIPVLNKSDLPAILDIDRLPSYLSGFVRVSAKQGEGINLLTKKICQTLGAAEFDSRQPVCFTSRQEDLFKQLKVATSRQQAATIITELLKGRLRV